MDTKNLENRTKRHVLCEMSNTAAPISSRYRAREKNIGNSQEEKITLYADEQSEIDKENLESLRSREVLFSEPPYIANIRPQNKEHKFDKELKNHDQVSDSNAKADTLIPLKKETGTSKKNENAVNSSDGLLHYIPPKRLGEKCLPNIGGKISRPPNAFMIFAKEKRQQIKEENPCETNRKVSIILGNLWRNLNGEEKAKYFLTATELEKEHKEKYPDYIYCPTEARRQKQTRLLKRQKTSQLSINSNESPDDKNESPKLLEKLTKKEVKAETPVIKLEKSDKGISTSTSCKEKYNFPCFSPNPMDSPIYWPYASEWMSPFHNTTGSYCNCRDRENDTTPRPLHPGYLQHPSRHLSPSNQSNKYGNIPFSYHPMFHPAVINPWLMFPSPFCAFNGSPGLKYKPNPGMDINPMYSSIAPYLVNPGIPAPHNQCAKDPSKEVKDPRKVKKSKIPTKVEKATDSPKIKKSLDSPKIEAIDLSKIKDEIESPEVKEVIESPKIKEDKDSPAVKEDIFEHDTDSDSHHSLMIVDENLELEDILLDVRERVKGKRGLEN